MTNSGLILLIDDNPDDFEATSRAIKKNELNNPIKWCASGIDAKHFMFKTGPYKDSSSDLPILIFLDLNMPGLDGRALLKEIKAASNLKHIPVVVLTTSSASQDVNACYRLGAATYVQKPLDFASLSNVIKTMKEYWFSVAILPEVD